MSVIFKIDSRSSSEKVLMLAHNLDENHPVHLGMKFFADKVYQDSKGKLQIKIYSNGQLGREREVLELIQLGAVAMTKVSALSLESFVPLYGVYNLPFIFRSKDHAYRVFDSDVGEYMLRHSESKQFRGLTYYDSGARSFYAKKPILTPSDLVGIKIRVMGSKTVIDMMNQLGGSPTPMGYGEIYTALQQGVIDGAENNISALVLSRHGEAAKHYSFDEHIISPDILIISSQIWSRLTIDEKEILKQAADDSKYFQRKIWLSKTREYKKFAEEQLGVEFHFPDKKPFVQKVSRLQDKLAEKGKDFRDLIIKIKNL